MFWVDRLVAATGAHSRGLDVDWAAIETRIGTGLPVDYKEFCEVFGSGEFSQYLTVYASAGGADSELATSQEANRRIAEQHPVVLDGYLPFGLYGPGGAGGILQWGASSQGDEFAWLVQPNGRAESWPVLARSEDGDWHRYDVSMSEFAYRLLADVSFEGFEGFGATTEETPSFHRA